MKRKIKGDSVKRFFFDIIKTHKKELTTILSIAAFGSLLTVFVPYIYGRLFDLALIPNTPTALLLSLIGLWAILGLISNFTSARTSALGDVLGAKISLESEVEAYAHFLTLPVSFHKTTKTGKILQKVSRGSWNLHQFIQMVSNILPSMIFLIFASVAMLIIRWELGLMVLFTFIIYSIATLKLTKPVIESQKKMHKTFEKEYGNVYDKLYNVFLIKNFAMEENEKKQFYKSFIGKALPPYKDSAEKFETLQHLQGVIYNLGFVIILGTAIFFLRNGQITQGEFIMFFGYINLSFSPFFRLSEFYNFYRRASVAIDRIINLKKLTPESMRHGDKILKDFRGEINFKNIGFSYNKDKKILNNINLKINSGESVALVGESGVGKTTLSEFIFGYYQPSKGNILLDKVDISKLKLTWLREQIAIVPQEISVFNDSLINNLKYANPKANFEEVVRAAKAANAHEFIMSLPKKYKTIVGARGVKLSVGQKQRIAITMAFLKNPKILVLDEPTSALDAKSERSVQEGIKNLISNRTTVIIAHRFSTVKNVDRIIVLDKGKIVEVGNHKELIKKRGKYHELYS
ncbi:MAG: ABC transporter ATP-binding protein, partial [Candidatus Aenigmarchaeota archaeon]|nr:ABC transporter ATP-binding protein [Candidatus Aenigmarchaeota archaeon]